MHLYNAVHCNIVCVVASGEIPYGVHGALAEVCPRQWPVQRRNRHNIAEVSIRISLGVAVVRSFYIASVL